MLQNMGKIGNTSDKPTQHKLYTLKQIIINEVISIIGFAEVKINWNKIPIKENIYIIGRMEGLKQGELVQDIMGSLLPTDLLKVEAQTSWRWMKYHVEQLK